MNEDGGIGSRLSELALVLVCFNHVASFIINADHSVVRTAVEIGIAESVRVELWFLSGNFFVNACGGHVEAESANAGLRHHKSAAGKF